VCVIVDSVEKQSVLKIVLVNSVVMMAVEVVAGLVQEVLIYV
jgi:hypothetical protein